MRTCQGYESDWTGDDQVGTYDAHCGGETGDEPIESLVLVGYDPDAVEEWAVLDLDEDWEGPGVVSRHPTRAAAWTAAEAYLARRRDEERDAA